MEYFQKSSHYDGGQFPQIRQDRIQNKAAIALQCKLNGKTNSCLALRIQPYWWDQMELTLQFVYFSSFTAPPDPCNDNACLNAATCITISPEQYECNCMAGFTGNFCEIGTLKTQVFVRKQF